MTSDSQTPLTPEELIEAGEAIYGAGWKSALARDLNLRDEGQMDRMARGKKSIPLGFRAEIAEIARVRSQKCREIHEKLSRK